MVEEVRNTSLRTDDLEQHLRRLRDLEESHASEITLATEAHRQALEKASKSEETIKELVARVALLEERVRGPEATAMEADLLLASPLVPVE